jgi:integrase/recombinase XerD
MDAKTRFKKVQRIISWLDSYYRYLVVKERSRGTLDFYKKKLNPFLLYCEDNQVFHMEDLTAEFLEDYLVLLRKTHNKGGVHAAYRCIRSFLRWYEFRTDQPTPIHKVKLSLPKTGRLDPIPFNDVEKMLLVSSVKNKAMIYFLYDTGVRAREMMVLRADQYDSTSGEIKLTDTKNKDPRTVVLGKHARRAMREYLFSREDKCHALFCNNEGEYYAQGGIQHVLARICKRAGVNVWYPHSFRRSYALNCLRNGVDIYTLQLIMGHKDLQILRLYLKQTEDDLRIATMRYSPGDEL